MLVKPNGLRASFFLIEIPAGQRAVYGGNDCEVVGVVGDVRGHLQNAGANAEFYIPLAVQGPRGTARLLVLLALLLLRGVRHEVEAVDPRDQAVAENAPKLNDALDDTLRPSLAAALCRSLIAFASAALLLAVLGILQCHGLRASRSVGARSQFEWRSARRQLDVRNLVLGSEPPLLWWRASPSACPSRLLPAASIRPCFSACIRPICPMKPIASAIAC